MVRTNTVAPGDDDERGDGQEPNDEGTNEHGSDEFVDVTPPAARIAEGLRDTGYDLNTAVADIVDNSIAANASIVDIEFVLDPRGNVRFSVADDGDGMDSDGLINALTYGAQERQSAASLGKFGLGLKTASTAFARKLIVLSRPDAAAKPLAFSWDLDEVERLGWKIRKVPNPDQSDISRLEAIAPQHAGTVVRWQKIDRVMERNYQQPTGAHATNAIKKKQDGLREHIAMVYHRFLNDADTRARNVEIRLNGIAIEPFDPFAWGGDLLFENDNIEVVAGADIGSMTLRAFVLPKKEEMQREMGADSATQARLSNAYQGIYIFRENRMIHGPDWLGIWTKEPHFTLARVELSFDHLLDEVFKIDVKKSRITLQDEVLDEVEEMIRAPRHEANQRYRTGTQPPEGQGAAKGSSIHANSNSSIGGKASAINTPALGEVSPDQRSAVIENAHGSVTVTYVDNATDGIFVEAVPELPEGLFYRPAYIGRNPGVQINMSHPYYDKVYIPNKEISTTIQGLDSLLWALSSAEFRSKTEETKDVFEDIRYDLSRALRKLVEDLPGPQESDES